MPSPMPVIDRKSSEPLFGLSCMYANPSALERIGPDWDWIWIDGQHGDMDYREATNLVRVCSLIGRPGIVRIPAHDPSWIGKLLDIGAAGIIVPMVESVAEAQAMVQAAKFPPLGNRSYGGRRVIDFQGRAYYKTANTDTLLIMQVESNEAVALSEQLAALPGVDGLFLGPDDLMIRAGHDVDAPKTKDSVGKQNRQFADACKKHGKMSVGLGVNDAGLEMAKEFGYRMIVGGGDVGFAAAGSKAAAQKIRGYFKGAAPAPAAGAPPAAKTLY